MASFLDVNKANAQNFFDINALAHETVFNTFLRDGVVIEHYPMWVEWVGALTPDWLEIHYREHLAWSASLGLPLPPDLSAVNLENDQARGVWLYNHAQHHQIVEQALGI